MALWLTCVDTGNTRIGYSGAGSCKRNICDSIRHLYKYRLMFFKCSPSPIGKLLAVIAHLSLSQIRPSANKGCLFNVLIGKSIVYASVPLTLKELRSYNDEIHLRYLPGASAHAAGSFFQLFLVSKQRAR